MSGCVPYFSTHGNEVTNGTTYACPLNTHDLLLLFSIKVSGETSVLKSVMSQLLKVTGFPST